MQFEEALEQGRLLKRYKRFFADIESADGEVVVAHCPNTGSMLNCLQEGAPVWFVRNDDPKRKLKATLEILETPHGRLACVNTGRANALVEEALNNGVITELAGFDRLRREVRYGEEKAGRIFVWSSVRNRFLSKSKALPSALPVRMWRPSLMR